MKQLTAYAGLSFSTGVVISAIASYLFDIEWLGKLGPSGPRMAWSTVLALSGVLVYIWCRPWSCYKKGSCQQQ